MKVTPINKKFGKYEIGQVFNLPDKAANIFIKLKKLKQVMDTAGDATLSNPTYSTRMLTAENIVAPVLSADAEGQKELTVEVSDSDVQEIVNKVVQEAPYGYKADGTPRLRPSRHPVKE